MRTRARKNTVNGGTLFSKPKKAKKRRVKILPRERSGDWEKRPKMFGNKQKANNCQKKRWNLKTESRGPWRDKHSAGLKGNKRSREKKNND